MPSIGRWWLEGIPTGGPARVWGIGFINAFGSIRVPDSIEPKGLDESELGEAAYNLT